MIKNGPLLSIIVPIYNVEKYLPSCIESLITQTYKNIEIILVNDGSPDGCSKICNYYQSIDGRIKVIHKKNEGLVKARKSGLEISDGNYIGFVDGDDWVESTMYEELMYHVLETDVDIVAAGHKEEIDGIVVETLINSLPCGFYSKIDLIKKVYPYMICTGLFSHFGIFSYLWNKVFRKEVLFVNQMAVDDKIFMAEDAACTYPSLLTANSLYISSSNCYHYRQRIDSMVKARNIDSEEIERYNILYKFLFSIFSKTEYSKLLIPKLALFLLSLFTVRSGLDFENSGNLNELFAFGDIPNGANVVVCGAGTFGQHLVKRIMHNKNFKLVCWVDALHEIYCDLGMPIESISYLNKVKYDFLLVAYINENNAENTKLELINNNVNPEKILLVNHYMKHPIKSLLKSFGLNYENAI